MFGFIPNIGIPELILILVVALVIFGPSKLPELGKGLGKGLKEFKNATDEIKNDLNVEGKKDSDKEN